MLSKTQTCHAFPICILVGLQELKSFLLCKKTVLLTHCIIHLSFFGVEPMGHEQSWFHEVPVKGSVLGCIWG